MSDILNRIKDAKLRGLETFYENENGRIIERRADGSEQPTGYYLENNAYKLDTPETVEPMQEESPANPMVIFIFLGMLILLGMCIAYFLWPSDDQNTEIAPVAVITIAQRGT